MKGKVLLLLAPHENMFVPDGYFTLPPMSLGVLSHGLRENGYETQLADLNFVIRKIPELYNREKSEFLYDKQKVLAYMQGENDDEINGFMKTVLQDFNLEEFQAAGISIGADFSFYQIHFGFLLAVYLQKNYNITVIIGGNNVNFLFMFQDQFYELWKAFFTQFDFIVKGPGESVINKIMDIDRNWPKEKQREVITGLSGILYWNNNSVAANPENKPAVISPDFDTLDLSVYEHRLLPSGSKKAHDENIIYLYQWPHYLIQYVNSVRIQSPAKNFERKVVIPYIFNYNCPYRCTFCSESDDERKKVIIGDPGQTVKELKRLKEKHNTPYFYFLNNAINNSVSFSDAFCEMIINEGLEIYWSDCGRFNKMTYERLENMYKAGCRKLTFGFETASSYLLKYIDKRLDLEQAARVLRWCREIGIWADMEVIVGLPYESDENFAETAEFIKSNREFINYLSINEYFIVPRSLLGAYPEKYDIRILKGLVSYDKMLGKNRELFLNEKSLGTVNFRIYQYEETNNTESFKDIMRRNKRHLLEMNALQGTGFKEIEKFYRIKEYTFQKNNIKERV